MNMFKKINGSTVESDEGFIVEPKGINHLAYREGLKKVTLYTDILTGKHYLMIYTNGLNMWDTGEPISEQKKVEIVNNIQRAFDFLNLSIIIE
jgi:hypothetical protein